MIDEREGLPSASKMDRVAHCPGSVNAEREFSQEEVTEVTQEGTDIHDLLHDEDAPDALEEIEENSVVIAERLKDLRDREVGKWRAGKTGEEKILKEERFWLMDKNRKLTSAKLDYAIIIGDSAFVLDYKSGYKPVTESHKNYQVRTQVVTLWKAYPNLKEIRGGTAAYRFRENFSMTDYSIGDLLKAERELRFILWRAEQPDAERIPGEWCDYCKAKANCPQAGAMSLLPVETVKDCSVVPTDEEIRSSVAKLDLKQLAYLNSKKTLAEKVFAAVKTRLKSMPDSLLNKVGLKHKIRDINKPDDISGIFREFMHSGLLKKEECAGCCNIVIGRIVEIAVPRLMEKGVATKKDATLRVKKMLEPFMLKVSSSYITNMTREEMEKYGNKERDQR